MAQVILGISPGTRLIGVAVMKKGELIRYGVKTFQGKWSKEKLQGILGMIENLTKHYSVTHVALRAPDPLHGSLNLNLLMSHIRLLSQSKNVLVTESSLEDLKAYCKVLKGSKDGIIERIAEKYPELKHTYLKERNNLRPYFMKMFEAIAAAEFANRIH